LHFALVRRQAMRYGENPHQQARSTFRRASRREDSRRRGNSRARNCRTTIWWTSIPAWALAQDIQRAGCRDREAHNNPCGAAEQASLAEA